MIDINVFYIICIILFQSIVLIVVFESVHFSSVTGYMIEEVVKVLPYLSYIVVFLTAITVIAVSKLSQISIRKRELEIQELNNRYLQQLNDILRGQRHDFSNHLQVMRSLLSKGEHSSVEKYLEDLTGDIRDTNDLLSIKNPVIAAIITAKMHLAGKKGILFEYDVQGELEGGRVRINHLSRVLGNLLDNALEAAEEAEGGEKRVSLKLYADKTGIYIEVKNTGSISPQVMERIFQPGVSTKKGENRGMGLYVVKSIADMYSGRVQIDSSPEKGVRVLVELPG